MARLKVPARVNRGTGIPGALSAAILRTPFDGKVVTLAPGIHSDVDTLRDLYFSEKARGVRASLTGVSIELTEQGAGESVYTMTVGVTASAPTVNTEFDTLHRLHDWLSAAVGANPNLDGACIHAAVVEADFVQRPGSRRVVLEATVEASYTRGRR